MRKILIVSGHPDLKTSVANATILETLEKELPQAEIARLDSLYPDFKIDVKAEQERLVRSDVIVLQFPLFWYSAPSLLERWMEETFTHGFSHGSQGHQLKGKKVLLSITAGAPAELYTKGGPMGFPIEDFLHCYEAMCNLTGMEYLGYVFTGGIGYVTRTDDKAIAEQKEHSRAHARRLISRLEEFGA